jgi:hypothetical protein
VPLFSEMGYVLHLWLGVDDEQTIFFSRLMLIYGMVLALSNPITFVMHATGKVKQYHTIVEIPTLLVAPVTYVLYLVGLPAYTTYITMIVAIVASHVIRVICINKYYQYFQLKEYLVSFILRSVVVTAILVSLYLLILTVLPYHGITRLIVACLLSVLLTLPLLYSIGLVKEERAKVNDFVTHLINKQKA